MHEPVVLVGKVFETGEEGANRGQLPIFFPRCGQKQVLARGERRKVRETRRQKERTH